MAEGVTFWKAAFDRGVLKFVTPAYLLPVASGVASSIVSAGVLGAVWPFLFAPAFGLHALLALSVANRADEPREERREHPAPPALAQQQARLEQAFREANSPEGFKAAQDLGYEYIQLRPVLERRRLTDSHSIAQLPLLAEETYRLGLSVLEDALQLISAVSPEDRVRLEADNATLKRELAALGREPSQEPRAKIKQAMIDSNNELLEMMSKQQARVDELLYQSDRCGASLHRTRMELAALRADNAAEGIDSVLSTLKLTISHARGVQDEMKRLAT